MISNKFLLLCACAAVTACSVPSEATSDTTGGADAQSGGDATGQAAQAGGNAASTPAQSATSRQSLPAVVDRGGFFPPELRTVPDAPGAALCPIDSVNNRLVAEFEGSALEAPFKFTGWMAVDSPDNPVSARVFGGFLDASGNLVGLVEGKRVERPDLAVGNPKLGNAGFAIEGYSPSVVGTYRVVFFAGDSSGVARCDSGLDFAVTDQ